MPLTNFPNGISANGVPTMGTNGLPVWPGQVFFVNESTGSNGNTGEAGNPFATLDWALGKCTANQNDCVVFEGTIHLTSTLTWSKNQVHLIGSCAPLKRGKRARISSSGSTVFSPMVDVTASGCNFVNFGTFYGYADASAQIAWLDEGGRNCYDNVEILGFGNATAAAQTGSRALKISGSTGENTFRNCVLGVDTVTRNATNATLEFTGASPRNYFINCDFEAYLGSSGGAATHIYTAASGAIDRYAKFENCTFNNATKSGATAMNQVISVAASAGGYFDLSQCRFIGATAWETTPTNQCYVDMAIPSASGGGKALNNS